MSIARLGNMLFYKIKGKPFWHCCFECPSLKNDKFSIGPDANIKCKENPLGKLPKGVYSYDLCVNCCRSGRFGDALRDYARIEYGNKPPS